MADLKIAVLVSGGGTNLQAIIDGIDAGVICGAEIVGVISTSRKAFALQRAEKHKIKTCVVSPKEFESQDAFDEALLMELGKLKPDLIVLAGCIVVISDRVVNAYERRIINIHPSLIPAFSGKGYYGLLVHEAALKRGVKITGATVHFVSKVVDGGEIIAQKAVDVLAGDTPESLQKRVMEEAEWKLLPEVISDISKGNIPLG